MQPLNQCPQSTFTRLLGVLADIDDTITTHGRLTALAYSAMENIRAAGLLMIPITGRPAGWCDHIARMWPVDAVVGENGAFWFCYDTDTRQMQRYFVADDKTRAMQRERLRTIAEEILCELPKARIAADQLYREADLAIDYCEDVERLTDAEVERIVAIMRAHGLTAKVSSIHVNGWFGAYDKLTTTLRLLAERFHVRANEAKDSFAFVGDSPNDQPMFEYCSCSIGVANVRDFAARMKALPAYITTGSGGSGFAEFANRLIHARSTPSCA